MKVKISELNPHPLNRKIYGHDDNIGELVEKIRTSNYVKPILINSSNIIISGHRRVEACKRLSGITEIECEIVDDDPVIQLELLVSENFYRVKTTSQLVKEAEVYEEIERHKAYQRKIEAGKQNLGQSDGVNWSQLGATGRTSKIVSKKVGMSEASYKRAKSVRDFIKEHPDWEWIFNQTINQSIDGAVQMTKKSQEFIEHLIDRVSGNTELILPTFRELVKEEQQLSYFPLPPGQYGIIFFDFSNKHTGSLLNTDISTICEQDCILCIWVRPFQLNSGLDIGKNWGFRYCTCLLWNKDNQNQVSLNGEILIVMVKGSPKVNFKIFESSPVKPDEIEQMIKEEYQGWSTVELFVGDGWKIW